MKLLTLNFLTCAVKSCKSSPASFPLHVRDAELERVDIEFNPLFVRNLLPRLEWGALKGVADELSLPLPSNPATADDAGAMEVDSAGVPAPDVAAAVTREEVSEETLRALHALLLETQISSGKLVCGNCGHEYRVLEGIANFLLPAHLV